jgi:hypothetical protein
MCQLKNWTSKVAFSYNPSTQETKTKGLQVNVSQGYTAKPDFYKTKIKLKLKTAKGNKANTDEDLEERELTYFLW